MTLQPESQDSIFTRIRDAIAAASSITNFSDNSPEKAIADDAFAAEMRERQHEALSVQLSARIDYAGKTITDDDLEDLGLDPSLVDLDLLNSFQSDDDLDELAKRNSTFRDPGSFATGTVTFQTSSSKVTIPEGTVVGTQPDADGDFIGFETTEEVTSASGSTSVSASIEAQERGTQGNVGSGTITYIPNPPPGVQGDPPVNNSNATSGGEDRETNAELRKRAKQALIKTSGGGTAGGVEGGMIEAFDGLDQGDVIVDEDFANNDFDVVVDGGPSDADAEAKIDELQPAAVEGILVRPTAVNLDITVEVTGTDVDTTDVENDITDYLAGLGLDADVVRDQIIATIINADSGIDGISTLTVEVVNETHTHQSSTDVYGLNKAPIVADSVKNVVDASGDTYTNGTDYDEVDSDADGEQDAIDWSIGGARPDDGENFDVDYEVPDDITIGSREKAEPATISVTVV